VTPPWFLAGVDTPEEMAERVSEAERVQLHELGCDDDTMGELTR